MEKKQELIGNANGSGIVGASASSSAFASAGSASASGAMENLSKESAAKLDWKEQKELQAKQRKKENEVKRIEERIEALELRDAEIDELMAQPEVCTNVARLQELSKEKDGIAVEMEELMERWEELESVE